MNPIPAISEADRALLFWVGQPIEIRRQILLGGCFKPILEKRLFREEFPDFYTFALTKFGFHRHYVDECLKQYGLHPIDMAQFNSDESSDSRSTPARIPKRRITNRGASIYVLLADGTDRVKIGFSRTPDARIKFLQAGCPFPLVLIAVVKCKDVRCESAAHQKFASLRRHGEWFEFGEEIKDWIAENETN